MVIEKLPLLDSSYDEWDWEHNTCSYWTPDVYDAYYMALIRKDGYGYCRNFACDVWNRIRYKLIRGIYREAGLEEDLSFVPDGALTMKYGEEDNEQFTAWRFNDAIVNVDMLNIFRFNWERTNNMPGFLGRRYVRGFADYGEQSDYVYAWYILELVEKANKLIRILKNEYTFSELYGETSKILTSSNSSVAVPRAGILDFVKEINAEYLATVAVAGVLAQSAQEKSFSGYTGKMNTARTMGMNAIETVASYVDALSDRAKTAAMAAAGKGATISGSDLSGMAFVGQIKYAQRIVANIDAKIDVSNLSEVSAAHRERSVENAILYAIKEMLMGAKSGGESHALTSLQKLERINIETKDFADSFSRMELSVMDRMLMTGAGMGKSVQNSVMQYFVARYIKKDIYAVTIPKAIADTVRPFQMQSDCVTKSKSESRNDVCESKHFETEKKSETLTDAIVRGMQRLKITAISGGESSASGSIFKYCDVVRIETHTKTESKTQVAIEKRMPKAVETAGIARTAKSGEMITLPQKMIKANAKAYGKCNSKIEKKQTCAIDASVCAEGTMTRCMLELEYNPRGIWKDPIRNGNNLHIRSAFPQWKDGSNVHVDSSGVFYEPEQNGNNVYIRSNESMKGW